MKKREKPSTRDWDWDNERLYPQKEKSWKQIWLPVYHCAE